jgi:hypothetical protein
MGEATVPPSVQIPAGSTSAPFTITLPNGATAGPVTITASAQGWNTAARTLTISTTSVADLAVTGTTLPPSPQTGQLGVPVSWTVTNDGSGTATGSWNDHVVLSTDPAGQNILFSQDIAYAGGSLTAGSSYTGSTTFNVPSQVGVYYLTVTTNSGSNAIPEITTSNDAMVSALNVGAAYYATLQVQAGEKQVAAGSPLTVSGKALYASGSGSPTNAILYIAVFQDGKPLEADGPIDARSDGTYSYTFAPSSLYPGDHKLVAGDYQFYAVTDGLTPAQLPVQSSDTATVLGMSVRPSPVAMKLVPGTPLSDTVTITNQSSVPLTNLVVTRVDEGSGTQTLPILVSFVINNPVQLPGTTTTPGQLTATYTLTATRSIAVSGRIFVTIDDDQNVPVTVELEPTITPPTPRLTSTSVSAGVVVGTDTLAGFTLTNTGSASSGPITIVSPVPWITPAGAPAPLGPGQSEQVEIQLTPPEGQQLGQFNGTLVVDYANVGLAVPLSVNVVSDQHGTVQVVVDDESTTATETGGHFAGAQVQLIDPATGQFVASGTSTASGITLTNVTSGTYELEVSAPQHAHYTSPIVVQPGTNSVDVFLHQEMVTYTWTVVPTAIQDTYAIQLQADFVTQVPIPNLVPDKPFVMPLLDENLPGSAGGSTVFFTENITNEGLIAATNVQITAVGNGTFTLTPLVKSIPVLPAQSEYAIPVELSANPGVTVEAYDQGNDCCHLPELDIRYSYVADRPVEQIRQVKVDPVFVTDGHFVAIQDGWGASAPASAAWPRISSTRRTRPSSSRCSKTPPMRRRGTLRGTPSAATCPPSSSNSSRRWRTGWRAAPARSRPMRAPC